MTDSPVKEGYRRVRRTRQAARRAYDRMSPIYDFLTFGEGRAREELLSLTRWNSGDRILDLGTGTGTALRPIASRTGPAGLVVGLDLSPGMLARARRRAVGEEIVCLVRGDAATLPLGSSALDAVVMSFSLELFDTPEIPAVLAECRRVLTPRGRLLVGALAARAQPRWPARIYEGLHDRFPEWLDCRPIPVRLLLQEAGFVVDDVKEMGLWGLPVDLIVARRAMATA